MQLSYKKFRLSESFTMDSSLLALVTELFEDLTCRYLKRETKKYINMDLFKKDFVDTVMSIIEEFRECGDECDEDMISEAVAGDIPFGFDESDAMHETDFQAQAEIEKFIMNILRGEVHCEEKLEKEKLKVGSIVRYLPDLHPENRYEVLKIKNQEGKRESPGQLEFLCDKVWMAKLIAIHSHEHTSWVYGDEIQIVPETKEQILQEWRKRNDHSGI